MRIKQAIRAWNFGVLFPRFDYQKVDQGKYIKFKNSMHKDAYSRCPGTWHKDNSSLSLTYWFIVMKTSVHPMIMGDRVYFRFLTGSISYYEQFFPSVISVQHYLKYHHLQD